MRAMTAVTQPYLSLLVGIYIETVVSLCALLGGGRYKLTRSNPTYSISSSSTLVGLWFVTVLILGSVAAYGVRRSADALRQPTRKKGPRFFRTSKLKKILKKKKKKTRIRSNQPIVEKKTAYAYTLHAFV